MEDTKIVKDKQKTAPFNMAFATLERLSKILEQITMCSTMPDLDRATSQIIELDLIKKFYTNSAPLLDAETIEKFKWILSVEPTKVKIVDLDRRFVKIGTRYDLELDTKLNVFLIDIQVALQDKGFFMPSKADPRFGWSPD